jgi:hypothetical protein
MIPLYGYMFEPFVGGFYPAGISLKADFVPFSWSWGDLGLGLAGSWNMLNAGAVEVHMGSLYLNGIYQRQILGERAALIARLGAGADFLNGTDHNKAATIFNWILSMNGGVFFRWFLPVIGNALGMTAGTFFVEAGIEYTQLFAVDSPTAYIKPGLGVGWKL